MKESGVVVGQQVSGLDVFLAKEEHIRRSSLKIFEGEAKSRLAAQGVKREEIFLLASDDIRAILPEHADRFGISSRTAELLEKEGFAVSCEGFLYGVSWAMLPEKKREGLMHLKLRDLAHEYVSVRTLKRLLYRIKRQEYLVESPFAYAGLRQ